jgi:cellulose synthase (UDP-forming)
MACPIESAGRTLLIRLVGLTAIGVGLAYLSWRAAATLNLPVWWISVPLLVVEIHAFLGFGLFLFSLWSVAPLAPAGRTSDLSVAVLIPTYDEDLTVLLPTVATALALRRTHETWVLDDGRRPEVEEMCRELGARYLTRSDNRGAKAGNLNNAISHLHCDLIAVLDADHVPELGFLERTIPFFGDPDVAVVQTPQDFYNVDSFEHAAVVELTDDDPLARQRYHEQALFYRVIQAGKNRWNAAFWCGTSAVLRLEALRSIGGIATETITEDIHTTVRLHRAGWRTVYLNQVLARGLAAKTVSAYALQRRRWGTGAMQLLRRENPLTASGLSLSQRLAYATTLLGWFDAWRTLAFLLLPAITLFTGASPIRTSAPVFIAFFLAYFLTQQIAVVFLGRGYHRPIAGQLYELARMPANISATLQLLRPTRQAFRVTPKGRSTSNGTRDARPLIAILGFSCVALAWYGAALLHLTPQTYAAPWVARGAALWLLVNALLMLLTLRRTTAQSHNAEQRCTFRFPTDATARFDGQLCSITDLSMSGARLRRPTLETKTPGKGTLHINHRDIHLHLEATVTGQTPSGEILGIEFEPTHYTQLAVLAQLLFHDTTTDTPEVHFAARRPRLVPKLGLAS